MSTFPTVNNSGLNISNNEPIEVATNPVPSSHYTPLHSERQLHEILQPVLDQIQKCIDEQHGVSIFARRMYTNLLDELRRHPCAALSKCTATALFTYLTWLLLPGAASGTYALMHFDYSRAVHQDTRYEAALDLTNFSQAAQFWRDAMLMSLGIVALVLNPAFQRTRREIIEECFTPYINDATRSEEERNELYRIQNQRIAQTGSVRTMETGSACTIL